MGLPSIVISAASQEAFTTPASRPTVPQASSGCTCAATTAAGAISRELPRASCSAPEG